MNDDYIVIGLDRYVNEHDELVSIRRENNKLREYIGSLCAEISEKGTKISELEMEWDDIENAREAEG